MKVLTATFLLFISVSLFGQKVNLATQEFKVIGQIKKELIFSFSDIEKFTPKNISDVAITNHLGEPRGIAKGLSGILIKDLLGKLELKEESPKRFSEFYLTFIAADNYKVVYSWNEIFNSPTGNDVYLITSRDGKKIREMDESILILTPTDFKTGRRHIKALSSIIVNRVD